MIEVPGETPTLPVTTVGPVLVTAEPAKTPKLAAVPNDTFCAHAGETKKASATNPKLASKLGQFLLNPESALAKRDGTTCWDCVVEAD